MQGDTATKRTWLPLVELSSWRTYPKRKGLQMRAFFLLLGESLRLREPERGAAPGAGLQERRRVQSGEGVAGRRHSIHGSADNTEGGERREW